MFLKAFPLQKRVHFMNIWFRIFTVRINEENSRVFMRSNRLIWDTHSQKYIDPDKFIVRRKNGFLLRHQYKIHPDRFECPECGQPLVAASSKNDNVYFRHLANLGSCIFKDEKIDDASLSEHYRFYYSREGERHKELKKRIGEGLALVYGVEIQSIIVDTKFIIKDGDKRRPDVYCRYLGRELVFEIQISELSNRFIHHRLSFYRKHGIFVFWILDVMGNPKLLSTMQRDIKYTFSSQNLFSLNEQYLPLTLICNYKIPFIFQRKEVHEKWVSKNIALSDLQFDDANMEVFFFDTVGKTKAIQVSLETQIAEDLENTQALEQISIRNKVQVLVSQISDYRKNDRNCYGLLLTLEKLSAAEVDELNAVVNMDSADKNKAILARFIREFHSSDISFRTNFIEFLLAQRKIRLDVNALEKGGRSALLELYLNESLKAKNYRLIPHLFEHGYRFSEYDRGFLAQYPALCEQGIEIEILKLEYYDALSRNGDGNKVPENMMYFLFIESAKQHRIIGSNVKSWVQFMMPILSRFKHFWRYTKIVLANTALGHTLKNVDTKNTIAKKVKEFDLEQVEQDEGFLDVLIQLYPEIMLM
jgi:hypothetical protein